MSDITKAIIPVAGLGTRLLPLSKVVPKEFLPVGTKPLLQYAIEEAKASGVQELIFITNSNKKQIADFLKRSPSLEKQLEEKGQDQLLEELRTTEKVFEGLKVSFLVQSNPAGDGNAILQAKKQIGNEPCFVLYPDDIIQARTPCCLQLAQVFKTSEKPVVALYQLPTDKLFSYGVAATEKIASRFHKIKKIVEKPPTGTAPSNLAFVGRRVITPEVFDYLKKAKPNKKGEVVLTEVLGEMVKDGKIVYGYEIEGRWWEAGQKLSWLQTHTYFALQDPEFGPTLKNFLKEEKLL
jgi:UTP--glucose-1-phosphate uridylyltransferase